MAHDVFVSFSGEDADIAMSVVSGLEKRDIKCWISSRDIQAGSEYAEQILYGINNCRLVVLILSSNSTRSVHVIRELERAANQKIQIVPFRIEDVEPSASIKYLLGPANRLDALTPDLESHIGKLAIHIKKIFDGEMADLLISYALEDEERIRPLAKAFEQQGWSVSWDRRVPAGQTWHSYIDQAFLNARCVIVAWSQHSITSDLVIEEAEQSKKRAILVPVLLDPVDPPLGFRTIHAADLTTWQPGQPSTHLEKLFRDIHSILGTSMPQTPYRTTRKLRKDEKKKAAEKLKKMKEENQRLVTETQKYHEELKRIENERWKEKEQKQDQERKLREKLQQMEEKIQSIAAEKQKLEEDMQRMKVAHRKEDEHKQKEAKTKHIFISHDEEDTVLAHRLSEDLTQLGAKVWIAPESIQPGETWVDAINRGLEDSSHMVVLVTKAAIKSEWVKMETNTGIALERKGQIKVIPLDVEPCDTPPLWSSYQMIPFRQDYEIGFGQLSANLKLRKTLDE